MITLRILFFITLISVMWFVPWWVTLAALFIGIVLFKNSFEFIFIAFVHDNVFGLPSDSLFSFQFVMTALAILFFLFVRFIRSRLL